MYFWCSEICTCLVSFCIHCHVSGCFDTYVACLCICLCLFFFLVVFFSNHLVSLWRFLDFLKLLLSVCISLSLFDVTWVFVVSFSLFVVSFKSLWTNFVSLCDCVVSVACVLCTHCECTCSLFLSLYLLCTSVCFWSLCSLLVSIGVLSYSLQLFFPACLRCLMFLCRQFDLFWIADPGQGSLEPAPSRSVGNLLYG